MAKHCTACGAALDDDGICTNENCKRRALQLAADSARQAAETAKSNAEQQRMNSRASAKALYLQADADTKATLGISDDWL